MTKYDILPVVLFQNSIMSRKRITGGRMAVEKITISIPEEVLAEIDRVSLETISRLNRSSTIVMMVNDWLRDQRDNEPVAELEEELV